MSGFHIPRWLDLILTAGDKAHKAVHPSRWGEDKPCECGKWTRRECEMRGTAQCENGDGGP